MVAGPTVIGLAYFVDRLTYEILGRELAAEFAALNLRGELHVQPERESDEVVAARIELERLLGDLVPVPPCPTGFGSNEMLRRTSLAELGDALEERASWYARLDALPEALWTSPCEPRAPEGTELLGETPFRHSDRWNALQEAVDHLCALAWYEGNQPDNSAEAGHWLARAVCLARVTDGGSSRDLHLRVTLEADVLELAQRLAGLDGVDPRELLAELGAELERFDESDRLERAAWCQLRWLERTVAFLAIGSGEGRTVRHRFGLLRLVRDLRAMLESVRGAAGVAARDGQQVARSGVGERERSAWDARTQRVSQLLASL